MTKPVADPTTSGQGRVVTQTPEKAATATALPDSAVMGCSATAPTVSLETVATVETDTLRACLADSQGREEDAQARMADTLAAATGVREPIMVVSEASVMPPPVGMPETGS